MKIAKLKKVDVRELWQHEDEHFTPWLAKDDNIKQLSEVVEIELEVIEQEKNVGPFRADILCKSTLDDHYVIIENQLEKTDHKHLGQIITYAAGLDAVTAIWIAKEFTEEHRATLDWLNRITDEQFNFFGIEIEAYRIGDSAPAPLFQLVSKPNEWSRTVKSAALAQDLTETKAINLEYWTSMKKYFEETGTSIRSQKPQACHWTSFALGKSGFHMSAVSSVRDNFIKVDFVINKDNAKEVFEVLKRKYENSSYEEVSKDIVWAELPDKKVSMVYIKKSANVRDKSEWRKQHQWILENLEKFDKFFRRKIQQI